MADTVQLIPILGLKNAILNTPHIIKDVALYSFSDSDELPAVFTMPQPPENALFPAITLQLESSDNTSQTRGHRIVTSNITLSVYFDDTESEENCRLIANRLFKALDRLDCSAYIDGFVACVAQPARRIESGDGFPIYIVETKVIQIEEY